MVSWRDAATTLPSIEPLPERWLARADVGDGAVIRAENFAGDGLDLLGGDLVEGVPHGGGVEDAFVVEEAFAGPGHDVVSGFEPQGKLAEAVFFGAVEFFGVGWGVEESLDFPGEEGAGALEPAWVE